MKYSINLDRMPAYALVQTEGVPSVYDFDKMIEAMVCTPGWKTGTFLLVDHRRMNISRLSSNDMRAIVGIVKKHSKKIGTGRCAFVMQGVLGFGIARMYELVGGDQLHQEIGVFYTIEDAVKWLKR